MTVFIPTQSPAQGKKGSRTRRRSQAETQKLPFAHSMSETEVTHYGGTRTPPSLLRKDRQQVTAVAGAVPEPCRPKHGQEEKEVEPGRHHRLVLPDTMQRRRLAVQHATAALHNLNSLKKHRENPKPPRDQCMHTQTADNTEAVEGCRVGLIITGSKASSPGRDPQVEPPEQTAERLSARPPPGLQRSPDRKKIKQSSEERR